MLGFHGCSGFSLGAESGGCFLVAVHGFLIVEASLVAEHGLWGMRASVAVAPGSVTAAPGHCGMGSALVAHGFRCSTAYVILPDLGLNPCLLH